MAARQRLRSSFPSKMSCWERAIPIRDTIFSTLLHLGRANRICIGLVFITLSQNNEEEGVASPSSVSLSMARY